MQMKPFLAVIATALVLGATGKALASESHAHKHESSQAPHKLTLDHGKKWTTDAPLRREMGELRKALHEVKHDIHKGRFTPEQYRALGETVEYRVGRIVADCKLPPEADANLHLVVADLIAAADVLQGKAPGKPQESAHQVAVALNQYGKHFDHPGWKPL